MLVVFDFFHPHGGKPAVICGRNRGFKVFLHQPFSDYANEIPQLSLKKTLVISASKWHNSARGGLLFESYTGMAGFAKDNTTR